MHLTLAQFFALFIGKQPLRFSITVIAGLGWAVDSVVFPVLFGRVIDSFIQYQGDRQAAWEVLGTPIIYCLIMWSILELCYRLTGFSMAVFLPKMLAQVRLFFAEHIHKQSHRFFVEHQAGNIANKIADIASSMDDLANIAIYVLFPCLAGIVLSGIIFYQIQPLFAILVVSWALVHLGATILGNRRSATLSETHANTRSDLVGYMIDTVTNYITVKLFARSGNEHEVMKEMQVVEEAQNRRVMMHIEYVKIFLGLWSFLGLGISINGYAFYCWKQELISVGDIVLIFQSCWGMAHLVWYAGMEIPRFFKNLGIVDQAISLLNEPIEVQNKSESQAITVTKGHIEFHHVTFGYKGLEDVLFDNLSCEIYPGEKVGLVGFSGSGKSSFVHLLLRLHDVNQGRITIDGVNIADVTQDSLHKAIAVIPQDPILFHRSVGENIAYGLPNATHGQIVEAAIAANAHDFISKQEHGYDSIVGERGVKLSGGQRQRIAIARAILKKSPIIIMDEATSALDSVTEAYIQENMSAFTYAATTIVVAHRLSTLMNMDRIMVFDRGRIVEVGTHQELLKNGEVYQKLWNAQVSGFLPA